MKRLMVSVVLAFFLATPALAGWVEDFSNSFEKTGVEGAVPEALKAGKTPADIVEEGLKLANLNPQNLLKALYCSGASGDDIKQAADANGISDIVVVSAFKNSVTECGDAVADSQAYTPAVAAGPTFAGVPAPAGSTGSSYASPSTF